MERSTGDSRGEAYAARLESGEGARWKRWLGAQLPYRFNLRRLDLGLTLDVGCGIGRNLAHLRRAVGVDPNPHAIAIARRRGFEAYDEAQFARTASTREGSFDSLLFSHVLEHMHFSEAEALVGRHLRFLRVGGRVVLIAPQEAGYRSDRSHVEFFDFAALQRILASQGLWPERAFSFPFPRPFGRVFRYNEFVVVGRKGGDASRL